MDPQSRRWFDFILHLKRQSRLSHAGAPVVWRRQQRSRERRTCLPTSMRVRAVLRQPGRIIILALYVHHRDSRCFASTSLAPQPCPSEPPRQPHPRGCYNTAFSRCPSSELVHCSHRSGCGRCKHQCRHHRLWRVHAWRSRSPLIHVLLSVPRQRCPRHHSTRPHPPSDRSRSVFVLSRPSLSL